MEKKIQIKNKSVIDYIESLQYEVEAHKDIIAYMIGSNMDITTEAFVKYQKKFTEFNVQYEEAKKKLESLYITDDVRKDMDGKIFLVLAFETGELTLRCKENG